MVCELCGRGVRNGSISRHHWIPKCLHNRKDICQPFGELDLKNYVGYLCKDCHSFLHSTFTEEELGTLYYTTDYLLELEEVQEWVKLIQMSPKEVKLTQKKRRRQSYTNNPYIYTRAAANCF